MNPGGRELIFRTCPDRPWGPSQPPVQWVPILSRGRERSARDADPSPPSSAVGHERVELCLYSSYGSYGLYRASVPVQGCTFPYLTFRQGILNFSCVAGETSVKFGLQTARIKFLHRMKYKYMHNYMYSVSCVFFCTSRAVKV